MEILNYKEFNSQELEKLFKDCSKNLKKLKEKLNKLKEFKNELQSTNNENNNFYKTKMNKI